MRRAVALLVSVGVVAACAGGGDKERFQNPIWRQNFRDPFVLRVDDTYHAYGTKEGGSIDPDPFRDRNGKTYLVWKNDWNCSGLDTWLYTQRLSADGRRLLGKPARLVKQDAPWEGSTIEAPTMWREDGRLYLFFSANDFQSNVYSVGYATCRTPLGPCKDARRNPILESRCRASGPGHQSIVRDGDDRTWIVCHAFYAHPNPAQIDITLMWLDRLAWRAGRPVVHGPTCRAQPAP